MTRSVTALTEEEIRVVKENLNKKTLKQIMALLPRWANSQKFNYRIFRQRCNRLGIKRYQSDFKIPYTGTYDQEYWKDLHLVNCYLAGNVAADGCLSDKNGRKYLNIAVSSKDEELVDVYIKELNFKGTKIKKTVNTNFSPVSGSEYCQITFRAFNKNAEYLEKHFNLLPQKTKRLQPTNLIDENLNFAYLIGYIDGDGSICCHKTQKGRFETITLSLLSCSKPLMEWVVKMIDDKFPIINRRAVLRFRERSHTWEYAIGGLRAAIVIDYLRAFPLQNYRLKRKWDNPSLLAWIEKKKQQFPDVFFYPNQSELAALMPKPLPVEVPQNPVLAV